TFLDNNGVDTSYLDFINQDSAPTPAVPGAPATHNLPSGSTIASSGRAIVVQTLKLVLGTVSAVGNFFIVLFLGFAFAAQPGVYRNARLSLAPSNHVAAVATL